MSRHTANHHHSFLNLFRRHKSSYYSPPTPTPQETQRLNEEKAKVDAGKRQQETQQWELDGIKKSLPDMLKDVTDKLAEVKTYQSLWYVRLRDSQVIDPVVNKKIELKKMRIATLYQESIEEIMTSDINWDISGDVVWAQLLPNMNELNHNLRKWMGDIIDGCLDKSIKKAINTGDSSLLHDKVGQNVLAACGVYSEILSKTQAIIKDQIAHLNTSTQERARWLHENFRGIIGSEPLGFKSRDTDPIMFSWMKEDVERTYSILSHFKSTSETKLHQNSSPVFKG